MNIYITNRQDHRDHRDASWPSLSSLLSWPQRHQLGRVLLLSLLKLAYFDILFSLTA
jgi:hypothetical protein